jgi:hypothetical protein
MSRGQRSDPVKLRRQQRAIAEDVVRRESARAQGDTVAPKLKPSYIPPAKPKPQVKPKRSNPTRSQGIVTGFKKGSNIA